MPEETPENYSDLKNETYNDLKNEEYYDLVDVPLSRFQADTATIRRAVNTQVVNESTIYDKMTHDYQHFINSPVEESMMNLLFEADIVNRSIHPEGVISVDRSACLNLYPILGGQVDAAIVGPEQSKQLYYAEGALRTHEDLLDSEREVLLAANALLVNNTKRQVVEIAECMQWMKENRPGLFQSIRPTAILKREEMLGYSGTVDDWSIKAKSSEFVFFLGEIQLILNVDLKKGNDSYSTTQRLRPDQDFSGVYYADHIEDELVTDEIQHKFFTLPSSLAHYKKFSSDVTPLAKGQLVKELTASVEPAKNLASVLSDEIKLMEKTASLTAGQTQASARSSHTR